MQFRSAGPQDITWLADTFLTTLRSTITETRGYWDEPKEREQFQQQLKLPDTSVVLLDEIPVAFYTAWRETDHLFLGTLCVTPDYQNRGIGTDAMRVIAQQADGLPVRLSVLRSNRDARRFYERLGCRWLSATQHHDHFEWMPRS